MVTLEADRLGRRYGRRWAVEGLSFVAHEGDIVGLLGPNGAGKTTTIRLLSTVLAPSSGRFAVAGVPCSRPVEIRRRVGVLPESAGYPATQRGEEYLHYHARLFGLPARTATAVAAELLAEVGLTERAAAPISTYSRGMRQRLGIARALLNGPAVVFLDEPTVGLDPAGQRHVLDLLRRIAGRRRATVILSTHTLTEVEQLCNRVVILHRGRTVATGTVAEVAASVPATRTARIAVATESTGRAGAVLGRLDGLTVRLDAERPGVITASLSAGPGSGAGGSPVARLNAALQALLAAGVPVLGFEIEMIGLGEAFLTMTEGGIG